MTADLLIAALYCLAVPAVGLALSRQASEGLEAYFLGNRRFGPFLMGMSGMTDWFDLSGTMVITSLLFLFGPRGLFIEFRGGAVLVLAFLMLWVGKWHRRSGCMTAAEWITFRFGDGRAAEALRTALAVFNAVCSVGMLSYAVRGAFLFFEVLLPYYPPTAVTALVLGLTAAYTAAAGFYGVTATNLVHGAVILLACLLVGGLAWHAVGEEGFSGELATRVTGVADWMRAWPSAHMSGVPRGYESFEPLLAFAALCLARTVIGGMGLGNETRFFAARDDRACGLQTLLQGLFIVLRWPMMMGFAVLGVLLLAEKTPTASADAAAFAEQVIPAVVTGRLPPVVRGIVLAALLGAMMSTVACTLNSAAATCVRDLYQRLWRPRAERRELMAASYSISLALAALSFWVGVGAPDLNRFWSWLAMGLTAGNCGPMFLRLYWWRCNAAGAAAGILCGMGGTLAQRALAPGWNEWLQFAVALGFSAAGTIIGSLATAPVEEAVTARFVRATRPFGWWGRYAALLGDGDRREHRRDWGAVPFVMLAQVTLFLFSMQLVLHDAVGAAVSGALCVGASFAVWRLWGRHL